MGFLDNAGLTHLWGKVQAALRSKMDAATYDPAGKARDVFGYVDSAVAGKAAKSTKASATITTTWTGSAAPYAQTISVAGVTADSVVEIALPPTATAEQVAQYQALNLQDGGQASGSITLRAFGKKNAAAIPVTVIVRGDL